MHVISSPVTWYVARAGGVIAYVLVTLSVVAGITLAGRVRVPGLPRFAVEDVHRFLGLLAGTFVTVHVVGIALDATVPFSLSHLFVPFTASFRPLWTGLGIVAMELLVALAITNRLRSRLPYRLWRALHAGAFLIWAAATAHGLMSGTDRDQRWLLAVYAAAAVAVVGSLSLRLGGDARPGRRLAIAGGASTAALAFVIGLSQVTLTRAPAKAARPVATAFSGPLTAAISTQDGSAARLVSVTGKAGTTRPVAFRIDLVESGNEVTDTSLQLRFASSAGSSVCTGALSAIDDSGFQGSCTLADGTTRSVDGTWSISGTAVTGKLTSQA